MTDERANNDWQHAYVACFPGTAQDETKYAKQVTDYLGISHTFMNIDSAVSEREFLRQLYCFEELWGNPQVPMMELYKKRERWEPLFPLTDMRRMSCLRDMDLMC